MEEIQEENGMIKEAKRGMESLRRKMREKKED